MKSQLNSVGQKGKIDIVKRNQAEKLDLIRSRNVKTSLSMWAPQGGERMYTVDDLNDLYSNAYRDMDEH